MDHIHINPAWAMIGLVYTYFIQDELDWVQVMPTQEEPSPSIYIIAIHTYENIQSLRKM